MDQAATLRRAAADAETRCLPGAAAAVTPDGEGYRPRHHPCQLWRRVCEHACAYA